MLSLYLVKWSLNVILEWTNRKITKHERKWKFVTFIRIRRFRLSFGIVSGIDPKDISPAPDIRKFGLYTSGKTSITKWKTMDI